MSRDFLIHNGKLTSDLDADGNQIKNLPGVAHLVDGKVPSDELPSYVDDVLEYATRSSFPETGEGGKIYVALDTGKVYRWSGTAYVEIANPDVDDSVTPTSTNPVASSGIWSAIWGTLASLPTGFTSLYDWVVDRLSGKLDADSGTMTGRFNLNGILNVNYSGGTSYEIDYYGIRVHYSGGVTKQIFMPYIVSYADGSGYMALVNNLAPDFSTSTTYYKGDLVKYNGALFICTATSHTGAWSASDFSVATIQDALADKLGHEGPWVNGYIDVLERVGSESVPYGVRIYRDKIVFGAFTNTTPRGFTPIREFALPSAGGTLALEGNIPYDLGTPIVINTASSENVEGETVYYGAATLANRTANVVQVTAATALDELRITFPAATSGKVRDFGLRVEIGTGSAALAAPALVPIAPTGDTIKIENNAAEIPALADGTATAKGVTLLYFSENAPGVFVVKGEQVEEVA